jgi:hypothetical protein
MPTKTLHRVPAHLNPQTITLPHPQEEAGDQKFIWGSKFRTSDMQLRVRRFLATYYDPNADAAAAAAGTGRGQPTYMQLLREVGGWVGGWVGGGLIGVGGALRGVRRAVEGWLDGQTACPGPGAPAPVESPRPRPAPRRLPRQMVMDGRFGLNVDMCDVYAFDRLLYQVGPRAAGGGQQTAARQAAWGA